MSTSGSRDARVHTQPSNRANTALSKGKSKAADDRRVVYKPVLENPHQIKWPPTPLNVQNSLLACLADLLPEVAEYHIARETASRKQKSGARAGRYQAKKKRAEEQSQVSKQPATTLKKRRREEDTGSDSKRAKIDHSAATKQTPDDVSSVAQRKRRRSPGINALGEPTHSSTSDAAVSPSDDAPLKSDHDTPPKSDHDTPPKSEPKPSPKSDEKSSPVTAIPVPSILKHCTFGINEVTKRLEAQANPKPPGDTTTPSPPKPRLRFVIACRTDVDPPILIEHLPILVAACNSTLPANSEDKMFVKLATLPMGGEHLLAETIGLRRIAVMALDAETPGLERLESLLSSVTILHASWLAPPSDVSREPKELVPTHVKQLKTSAPKDMKAAREKRKREIGEAKEAAKTDGGRRKRRKLQTNEKAKEEEQPQQPQT